MRRLPGCFATSLTGFTQVLPYKCFPSSASYSFYDGCYSTPVKRVRQYRAVPAELAIGPAERNVSGTSFFGRSQRPFPIAAFSLLAGKGLSDSEKELFREGLPHSHLEKTRCTAALPCCERQKGISGWQKPIDGRKSRKLRRKTLWARLKPLFWPVLPCAEDLEAIEDAERGKAAGERGLRLRKSTLGRIGTARFTPERFSCRFPASIVRSIVGRVSVHAPHEEP
jgi:hypothetical protein